MKTIEFNKKSWHYKLTKTYFQDTYFDNLCKYIRHLIYSLCLSVLFFVFCSVAGIAMISPVVVAIYNVVFGYGFGLPFFTDSILYPFIYGVIALQFVLFVSTRKEIRNWYFLKYKNIDYKEIEQKKKYDKIAAKYSTNINPNIFGMMYKTFKEKTCFRVEFK